MSKERESFKKGCGQQCQPDIHDQKPPANVAGALTVGWNCDVWGHKRCVRGNGIQFF